MGSAIFGEFDDNVTLPWNYSEGDPDFNIEVFKILESLNRRGEAAHTDLSYEICREPWPSPEQMSEWISMAEKRREFMPSRRLQLFFVCHKTGTSETGKV